MPINIYNMLHTIGKTILGGVRIDLSRYGYHNIKDSFWKFEPNHPNTIQIKIPYKE
jgi:hypothetical protein